MRRHKCKYITCWYNRPKHVDLRDFHVCTRTSYIGVLNNLWASYGKNKYLPTFQCCHLKHAVDKYAGFAARKLTVVFNPMINDLNIDSDRKCYESFSTIIKYQNWTYTYAGGIKKFAERTVIFYDRSPLSHCLSGNVSEWKELIWQVRVVIYRDNSIARYPRAINNTIELVL